MGLTETMVRSTLSRPSFEPSFHVSTSSNLIEVVWGVIHSVTILNPRICLGPQEERKKATLPRQIITPKCSQRVPTLPINRCEGGSF
jgi:hypothetical protein